MKHPNRIREIRKNAGLSMEQLASRVNTSRGQIYQLEKGLRKLSQDWMIRLAEALYCRPEEFIVYESDSKIPVIAILGDKSEVVAVNNKVSLMLSASLREPHFDKDSVHCDLVDAPPGLYPSGLVAIRVKGDAWEPYIREDEILFYERKAQSIANCVNERCVVALADGRVLFKVLKKGTQYGRYHLLSPNSPIMEDVQVSWCAIVTEISSRDRVRSRLLL